MFCALKEASKIGTPNQPLELRTQKKGQKKSFVQVFFFGAMRYFFSSKTFLPRIYPCFLPKQVAEPQKKKSG